MPLFISRCYNPIRILWRKKHGTYLLKKMSEPPLYFPNEKANGKLIFKVDFQSRTATAPIYQPSTVTDTELMNNQQSYLQGYPQSDPQSSQQIYSMGYPQSNPQSSQQIYAMGYPQSYPQIYTQDPQVYQQSQRRRIGMIVAFVVAFALASFAAVYFSTRF